LLTAEEQVLFRRLAVFTGGWTLDAVEAVCAATEGAEPLAVDMLEGLGILVDHSLIQLREEEDEPRFAMLQVIRNYALERLEAAGASPGYLPEAETLHQAHLAWYVALAERVEPWLIGGPRLREGLGLVEREHDNLRTALGWARTQGEVTLGLRLAGAVSRFWFQRWQLSEGRHWLEELLALHEPERSAARKASVRSADDMVLQGVWAKALLGAGELATFQGDFSRAESHLEESIAFAQETGNVRLLVMAHTRLGFAAQGQGDLGRAITQYERSMTLARQLGDPLFIVMPLENLGEVAYLQGDLARAAVLLKEAVEMDQRVNDLLWLADDLAWLANTRRRQGDLQQAFTLVREAFAVLQRTGEQPWPHEVESLAAAVGAVGRGELAARLLGAATAQREKSGAMLTPLEQADVEQAVAPARATLGEEAWSAAFAAGRACSLEVVIAEALAVVN
jgi:non-specific serine/threonine protein kinase